MSFFGSPGPGGIPYCMGESAAVAGEAATVGAGVGAGTGAWGGADTGGGNAAGSGRGRGKMCFNRLFL